MKRAWLAMLALALIAAPAGAQTTTTRTDRLIASTSVTIGGTSFTSTAAILGGTLSVTGDTTLTGDLAVNGNDLTSTGVLRVRPTGDLTLDPTGDVIIAADGAELLPATTYAYNIGAFSNKFNVIHAAELWIQTLVAQETIATIGGRILVAPTTQLSAALGSAVGDTTITVKHNSLANGDRIYLEAAGSVEFMAVTSAAGGTAGAYTYSVTRDLDGSGRNAWLAGDAVVNTGTTGDGFIDLYALRSTKSATEYGPTIVGNVRNSTTYNDWSPRWAAGNLNGIYGYSTDVYGFAAGNPSDTYFKIDATDGFQIYDGATRKFWLTTGGVMALYDSSTTYLQLTGGAIKMVEGGVEVFNLSSGVATFGRPLTSNNTGQIQIDSDSIDFRWRNNSGSTSTVLQISNSSGDAYFSMTGAMAISAYLRVPSVTNSAGDLVVGSEAVLGDVILSATGATRPDADGNRSLGESGYRWQKLFLLPTTTTATFNPLVLGTSGEVWEKTDGVSATFNPTTCTSMTFEGGILTAKAGC